MGNYLQSNICDCSTQDEISTMDMRRMRNRDRIIEIYPEYNDTKVELKIIDEYDSS